MGKSSSNTLNHTLCEVSCSSKDLFYRITSKDMGSNTCWPKNDLTRCGQELIFAALTLTAFLSRHPLLRCTGPTCPSPFALLSMCVNYYLLRTLAVVKTTAACVTWWSWRFLVIFTATAVSQTANDPPPPLMQQAAQHLLVMSFTANYSYPTNWRSDFVDSGKCEFWQLSDHHRCTIIPTKVNSSGISS